MRFRAVILRAGELIRKAFPEAGRECPGCGEGLKGLPPMADLCRSCADLLAEGISASRMEMPDGLGFPQGFCVILVTPDGSIGSLAARLMASGRAPIMALATAYAHAVPLGEYLLTDVLYLGQEAAGHAKGAFTAFARALASAFAASYGGLIREETASWQAWSIARYSEGAAPVRAKSAYPIIVLENADAGELRKLATKMAHAGAERMIAVVTLSRHER